MPRTNIDNLTFERWMDRLEHHCSKVTGLDSDSLGAESVFPCLRDAWADGVGPISHADWIIEASGFPREDSLAEDVKASSPEVRRFRGTNINNQQVALALKQRKVLGHLPKLY